MPGFLLNWKRVDERKRQQIERDPKKHFFWWDELPDHAAATRSGKVVSERWSVYSKQIALGDRIFLIALGGISDGIVASGYAANVPEGKSPLGQGKIVYLDRNWRTGEQSRYVTVDFDVIVDVRSDPKQVLSIDVLRRGDLAAMHWNIERPGVEIKPKAKLKLSRDLLPALEKEWSQHLQRIKFPLASDDDDDVEATTIFGYEGRLKMRTHKRRERDRDLVSTKKRYALRDYGKLECEVCKFVFEEHYGNHGSGFIECHHREPLSAVDPNEGCLVQLRDLALVCANCHRMLHRRDFPTVEQLRSRIQGQS